MKDGHIMYFYHIYCIIKMSKQGQYTLSHSGSEVSKRVDKDWDVFIGLFRRYW